MDKYNTNNFLHLIHLKSVGRRKWAIKDPNYNFRSDIESIINHPVSSGHVKIHSSSPRETIFYFKKTLPPINTPYFLGFPVCN